VKTDIRSKVSNETQYRNLKVRNSADAIDVEARTVELAFASELPYERWWGIEIIDTQRMDIDRLNDGGALLWNHDGEKHIGTVEKAWIDGDKVARATVRFSKRKEADDIFQDIVDGIVKHVSFGYMITDFDLIKEAEKKGELNEYKVATVTHEISMVHTPADTTVGIGRSVDQGPKEVVNVSTVSETDNNKHLEVSEMENTTETVENEVVETPVIDTKALEKEAFEKGVETRKAYVEEVKSLCGLAGFGEKADEFINENIEVKHVRETLAELKAEQDKEEVSTVRIEAGEDLKAKRDLERTKQFAHLMNPTSEASELYKGIRTSHGMIKSIMKEANVDVSELSSEGLVNAVLGRDHSTSDFPVILKDASNKVLLDSFNAKLEQRNFGPLVRERQVADYKDINVARLGESPSLELKQEGEEYKSGTVSETGETYKVHDYARMISFTDRALRNDDLGAFSRGLLQFASSAARKEMDVVWDEFQNGLVDGSAIYQAGAPRNTLHATTPLDIDGLSTLETAMMLQKGLDADDPLNLEGRYLVVPPALKTLAYQLMNGQYVPNTASEVNPYAGSMGIIVESRLGAGDWYMTSSLDQIDLLEMAFLTGRRAPMLDQRINFSTDSLDAKIKHTFGVKAIDFRGFQKAEIA